jgi:hypothetical protein
MHVSLVKLKCELANFVRNRTHCSCKRAKTVAVIWPCHEFLHLFALDLGQFNVAVDVAHKCFSTLVQKHTTLEHASSENDSFNASGEIDV